MLREIASKVQTMRKEADFQVTDHIIIFADGNEEMEAIMTEHAQELKSYVLADDIVTGSMDGYSKEWKINGHKVTLGVKVHA